MKYNDSTIMPFGKYKGEKLGNIPADYLMFINTLKTTSKEMKEYIAENMDVLTLEMKLIKSLPFTADTYEPSDYA